VSINPTFFVFIQNSNSPLQCVTEDEGICEGCTSLSGALLVVKAKLNRKTTVEVPPLPMESLLVAIPDHLRASKSLRSFTDSTGKIATILFSGAHYAVTMLTCELAIKEVLS
jgi:hypothetical protein